MKETLFDVGLERNQKAKPFLKWAGGKGQLIDEIDKRLPHEDMQRGQIDTYVEPFVGGGAVFFHVAQTYRCLRHFFLLDINADLVNCYQAVRNDVESLVHELRLLESAFLAKDETEREEYYYRIRGEFNEEKAHGPRALTAARLIFLNRTCYNGLYRVNRKGKFNVPFGDYKNPRICDRENLEAASRVLRRAKVLQGHFTESRPHINESALVYLDPPYRPISRTASFTSYAKDTFSEKDQIELAQFCREIDKKGARFLLSNSDPKNEDPNDNFFEEHYAGFSIARVQASRAISCRGSQRGRIKELIITNY